MLRSSRSPLEILYTLTAPRYEAAIAPIMRPLAADLVALAGREDALRPGLTALDLGTGTGLVAHLLAARGLATLGIDRIYPMLHQAQSLPSARPGRVRFVQADAEALTCLAPNSCDVVLASFGLAECDPDRALRAIRRVLRPGGRLYLQEWGPLDGPADPRAVVDDALAAYAHPETTEPLATLRAWLDRPRAWDARLQDADDYADLLTEHQFVNISTHESRPVTLHLQPGMETFVDYALAWAPHHLEWAALSPVERATCRATIATGLAPLLAEDGSLVWRPLLFRASGILTIL